MDLLAHLQNSLERGQSLFHLLYMQVERASDFQDGFETLKRVNETSYRVQVASQTVEVLSDPAALIALYDGFVVFLQGEVDEFARRHP